MNTSIQKASLQFMSTCGNSSVAWLIAGIIVIFNLLLYTLVFNWSSRLDQTKCMCSKDWRRTFAVVYPPIAVAITLISCFVSLYGTRVPHTLLLTVAGAVLIGWIVMGVGALTYLNDLVKKGCMCAKQNTIGDEALEVYAAMKIAGILAAALTLGMVMAMGSHKLAF